MDVDALLAQAEDAERAAASVAAELQTAAEVRPEHPLLVRGEGAAEAAAANARFLDERRARAAADLRVRLAALRADPRRPRRLALRRVAASLRALADQRERAIVDARAAAVRAAVASALAPAPPWVAEPAPIEEPYPAQPQPVHQADPPPPEQPTTSPDPAPAPVPPPAPPPPKNRRAAVGLAAGLALAGVAGVVGWRVVAGDEKPGERLSPAVPAALHQLPGRDRYTSVVAHATVPNVEIYEDESAPLPARTFDNPTALGAPIVFLVTDESDGDRLEVMLPVRPNGSRGWVRRDQVELGVTRFRIRVNLARHDLEVFDGADRVFRAEVGVGRRDTPTPGGRFYVKELIQPPDPDTIYGNYAYGLSGFSNTLEEFNGGEGVVGIHGTNEPAAVGKDVSSGCIRLTNDDMADLVAFLPLGTPVEIAA